MTIYIPSSQTGDTLTTTGTGACLLYGISRVVIGENKTFLGGEAYLKQRGVEVIVVDSAECKALMDDFIAEKPEVWYGFPALGVSLDRTPSQYDADF